jgi:hypothetical protein
MLVHPPGPRPVGPAILADGTYTPLSEHAGGGNLGPCSSCPLSTRRELRRRQNAAALDQVTGCVWPTEPNFVLARFDPPRRGHVDPEDGRVDPAHRSRVRDRARSCRPARNRRGSDRDGRNVPPRDAGHPSRGRIRADDRKFQDPLRKRASAKPDAVMPPQWVQSSLPRPTICRF